MCVRLWVGVIPNVKWMSVPPFLAPFFLHFKIFDTRHWHFLYALMLLLVPVWQLSFVCHSPRHKSDTSSLLIIWSEVSDVSVMDWTRLLKSHFMLCCKNTWDSICSCFLFRKDCHSSVYKDISVCLLKLAQHNRTTLLTQHSCQTQGKKVSLYEKHTY